MILAAVAAAPTAMAGVEKYAVSYAAGGVASVTHKDACAAAQRNARPLTRQRLMQYMRTAAA
jgi:hypothetical protein